MAEFSLALHDLFFHSNIVKESRLIPCFWWLSFFEVSNDVLWMWQYLFPGRPSPWKIKINDSSFFSVFFKNQSSPVTFLSFRQPRIHCHGHFLGQRTRPKGLEAHFEIGGKRPHHLHLVPRCGCITSSIALRMNWHRELNPCYFWHQCLGEIK